MASLVPIDRLSDHWLLLAFSCIVLYFFSTAIYNLYFHPLAKYPGPFWAKISAIPNFYHASTGYRHIWIWQCHQIYGPAVRYQPNGILFNTSTSFTTIYGNKANTKRSNFYEVWTRNEANINTLSTTSKTVHARKRRILNSVFSEKAIRSSEDFIVRHVDRWCELLMEDAEQGWTEEKNMSVLADGLIFDIMGDLSFGADFKTKERGENPLKEIPHAISKYLLFMNPIAQSPIRNWWVWLKPRGLDNLFEKITPKEIKNYYDFVDGSVVKRRRQEEEAKKSGLDENDARKDMFHYLFNATDPETGGPAYSTDELNAEANLLIIAGSDTTSTSMTSFFFYVCRNPRAYRKVVREIRETFDSVDEIRGGLKLSSCQYLRACIDEAGRMTPPGVTEMPREVLPGGQEIDGNIVPAGTQVGIASWAYHRNDENYGDAGTYRPERWIVDEENGVTAEDVSQAQSKFHPFSIGVGNCAGQKLAMLELMISIARTLYRMDARLAPGTMLGQGAPELGWGRRNKEHFHVIDAYVAIKNGPMVQFRKRQV